jgi:hypothetical protein
MLRAKRLALCLLMLCIGSVVVAQPKNRAIVNQSIEWFATTANIKIHKRLTWILDGQYRFVQNLEPMQFQVRTALDVKMNDHFSIAPLGYVYTINPLYGKQPASFVNNEHRIWQQAFYKHTIGRFKLDHRIRVEERYLQVHSKASDGQIIDDGYSDKRMRYRYRFMARVPLTKPSIDAKTLFASAYDEVFLSRGKAVAMRQPDQNRIFAGLGYQFTKDFSLQGGCLYQLNIKATGLKQENNVGFQILLGYNIDLTKKNDK